MGGGLVRAYAAPAWGCCFLGLVEPVLRALARSVLETGPESTAPVVFEVELEEWEIELENYSFNLTLPSMRFAVIFHLSLEGGAPRTTRFFAVLPDGLLDRVAKKLQSQVCRWDLRELDPRFAGFTQPAHVDFDLRFRWSEDGSPLIEGRSLRSRLDLPQGSSAQSTPDLQD